MTLKLASSVSEALGGAVLGGLALARALVAMFEWYDIAPVKNQRGTVQVVC